MASLINKMLNFVGWESEEEEEEVVDVEDTSKEEVLQPQFLQPSQKRQQGKVVNIHSASQFKVVIIQPESFDDAQDICEHLKSKKPVVINLENMDKDNAQRVIDFLSGSVYALDGSIQKVSNGIFIIAPNNVDLMGDFKDELRNKGVFSWAK
ncbi:cell division protein SepF [Clostridium thermosuccinogenes]|jgi:cell division inhibitor SepF|uniref:Cell division protein SepF n=1 Tax=Clostridium thermosuccinogenes TaxID=84032 RepID=A0A2K2FJ17_9CLOT|nr:cell division protein SepF [Pseudoclostridium thermosuccinogenes]AUS96185.1 cell division protein SepF [Pseudoclostridium thermosuccinogenes]PNT93132.1 cell division protein SepF [Pseudoclostridium thermosuccinogenes]PNT98765.1 cell division protein SepF [Pseudoclostridium thermosuccinogenes]PNU00764.1 cell division protein SepF [Pseudoclostridium thermosuccinogenes]